MEPKSYIIPDDIFEEVNAVTPEFCSDIVF